MSRSAKQLSVDLPALLDGGVYLMNPGTLRPAQTPGGLRARIYREATAMGLAVRTAQPLQPLPYLVVQAYNPWDPSDARWAKAERLLTVGCSCNPRDPFQEHPVSCLMGNYTFALGRFKATAWQLAMDARERDYKRAARTGDSLVIPGVGIVTAPLGPRTGPTPVVAPAAFAADEYDPYADIVEDDYADQIPAGWTPVATPPAEPA